MAVLSRQAGRVKRSSVDPRPVLTLGRLFNSGLIIFVVLIGLGLGIGLGVKVAEKAIDAPVSLSLSPPAHLDVKLKLSPFSRLSLRNRRPQNLNL